MKKPNTIPDVERIFNEHVKDPVTQYRERGCGFVKFRDQLTGKLFKIIVKEYTPKPKLIKKKTFSPGII